MGWMLRHAICLIVLLSTLTSTALGDLRGDVERAIRASQLKSASISVSIRDADDLSGDPLLSIHGDSPMIPASNMKLLTSGAALHILGPEYRFTTKMLIDDDRLIIVGDGDPGFGDPALLRLMQRADGEGIDVEAFLDYWVQAVVETGMTHIREIVIDDRIFDRHFVHPTWPRDQLTEWYCAEVAGLTFHTNVMHFFPRPGSANKPDISTFAPAAGWLLPQNSASSDSVRKDSVWIARASDTNEFKVFGNVKVRHEVPIRVAISHVPNFFAQLLRERLERAGIEVGGHGVVDFDAPESAGTVIGPLVTTPISTVLTRCNRDSQNLYAECLLKRSGAELTHEPGSWSNGAALVRHVVHERLEGRFTATLSISDGSGMSRENQVTSDLLTAWLASFHRDETLGPTFINSFAVAGMSGTLEKRFRDTRLHGMLVQAKSGYINGVSCLSGYVTAPDGRRRCFSVLVNDLTQSGSVTMAKRLQERIVAGIAVDMLSAANALGGTP